MTIGKQIAEAVRLHRDVSKEEAMERAAEVLDLVGLPRPQERLKDYPHQLSGGLRQRVMIAMALACDPKLLIADEPTTALDVTIQEQILDLLDRIKRELGMGIILITHDMGVIAGRADRVVVMYAGLKIETAETVELFTNVRHPYTEALLASIPQLDQDQDQELYSIPGLPPDLRKPPRACRFAAPLRVRDRRVPDPGAAAGRRRIPTIPTPASTRAIHRPTEMGDLGAELIAKAEKNKALMASFGKELELLETAAEPEVGAGGRRATAAPRSLLEFRDVSRSSRSPPARSCSRQIGAVHAVTDVNLGIRRGETFGLVGESGCGKTTLGRLGVALEAPDRRPDPLRRDRPGDVKGAKFRELRRDLAVHVPGPVCLARSAHAGQGDHLRAARYRPAGLQEERARRSGGCSTRSGSPTTRWIATRTSSPAASGSAWASPARSRSTRSVIVADEPVSALDVSIRSQILNLMKRLQAHLRADLHRDLPRPLGRQLPGGPDRRHVPGQARRDRHRRATSTSGRRTRTRPGCSRRYRFPTPRCAKAKKRDVGVRGELPSPINPPSGCRFRTRCPRAQDKCAEVVPPLRRSATSIAAACHFPLQTAARGRAGNRRRQPPARRPAHDHRRGREDPGRGEQRRHLDDARPR